MLAPIQSGGPWVAALFHWTYKSQLLNSTFLHFFAS